MLEKALTELGKAHDQNTQVFIESLQYAEAMLAVLQRAVNERASTTIDFPAYLLNLQICIVFADFAKWLAELAAPTPSRLVRPDSELPIVFGG